MLVTIKEAILAIAITAIGLLMATVMLLALLGLGGCMTVNITVPDSAASPLTHQGTTVTVHITKNVSTTAPITMPMLPGM